jgi:hypothetical protein
VAAPAELLTGGQLLGDLACPLKGDSASSRTELLGPDARLSGPPKMTTAAAMASDEESAASWATFFARAAAA